MKYKNICIILAACCSMIFFDSCKSGKQDLVDKIKSGEEKLFSDSTLQLNDSAARTVLTNYLDFTKKFPEDSIAPEMLFKAADLSNGLQQPQKAIELYGEFISKYPKHPKVAAAVFMQAFLYETVLNDKEKAKTKYEEFIKSYPQHPLVSSAKASFDQINSGMSDEQLIKMFEQKQDSANKGM